jgi:xanthine dehydrogenase YagR molybdenum-binding subunit
MTIPARAMGEVIDRIDGPDKVRGLAPYAFEQPVDHPVYLYPVHRQLHPRRARHPQPVQRAPDQHPRRPG